MDKITKMNLFPWLKIHYKNIVRQHQIKKSPHSILLQSSQKIGINKLVWNIGKWLLCYNKKNILFCNQCTSCILMNNYSHPDWYEIKKNINSNSIEINHISNLMYNALQTPQQGIAKIFFFSNLENFTENAIHILLKLIEEPPDNTWFFLKNNTNYKLIDTLISRCVIYNLSLPLAQESIQWLEKKIIRTKIIYQTALNICEHSPLEAEKLLKTDLWKKRTDLYNQIQLSVKTKNMTNLLSFFSNTNSLQIIYWISSLLLDILKKKYKLYKLINNLDQINLINQLSHIYSIKHLNDTVQRWHICHYQLRHINGINHELIILKQLLYWEYTLNKLK